MIDVNIAVKKISNITTFSVWYPLKLEIDQKCDFKCVSFNMEINAEHGSEYIWLK